MARISHVGQLVVLKSVSENRFFFWCLICVLIGKDFQKIALPIFLQFVMVRATHQRHVKGIPDSKLLARLMGLSSIFEAFSFKM